MRFYIWYHPMERLAIVDTGSDLIWVQCSPCEKCFPHSTPLCELNKSSTFTNLSCHSQSCELFPFWYHYCAVSGVYLYEKSYDDGSFTRGVLCTESIHFGSPTITYPKPIFGCALINRFNHQTRDKVTGIVGPRAGPIVTSIITRWSNWSQILVLFSSFQFKLYYQTEIW